MKRKPLTTYQLTVLALMPGMIKHIPTTKEKTKNENRN